ncbi:MAG: flavodoxin family protein [Methanomassiliicoccales archaeon]
MKIVAINGSPRKEGNTAKMLHEITKEHAKVDLKYFDLSEMAIADCKACMHCKTHDGCSIKDDMTKLYKAIHDADAVVLGSPIYMGAETATTKAFEDRLYAYLAYGEQRGSFMSKVPTGKKAMVVLTCGQPKGPEFYKPVSDRFIQLFGLLGFNPVVVEIQGGVMATQEVMEMTGAQAICERGRQLLSGECD